VRLQQNETLAILSLKLIRMIIEVLHLHIETHCVSMNNQTINIIYSYWQIVALCLKNYTKQKIKRVDKRQELFKSKICDICRF